MTEQRTVAFLMQWIDELQGQLHLAQEGERYALRVRDQWRAAYLQAMTELTELKLRNVSRETLSEEVYHDELV